MKSLAALVDEIDADELRRRHYAHPTAEKSREFFCPDCGRRCTRLTDGVQEVGHNWDCPRSIRLPGSSRQVATDGGERL